MATAKEARKKTNYRLWSEDAKVAFKRAKIDMDWNVRNVKTHTHTLTPSADLITHTFTFA